MSRGYRAPSPHPVPERVRLGIWQRVEVGSLTQCWPWRLSTGSHGYGQVGWSLGDGRHSMTTAHRVAWQALFGPLPEGLTVDHVCHNRVCCNPTHLRLLTNRDNAADNGQRDKSHCPKGHVYAGTNLIVNRKGHRFCRRCREEHNRARA